ncbi:MAG: hypothetical protein ACI9XK_004747 [Granulosicoccus sp.]
MKPIKNASAGNSTKSSTPSSDDNPTAASNITSTFVKQHIAATIVPTAPILNNRLVSILLLYAHVGIGGRLSL